MKIVAPHTLFLEVPQSKKTVLFLHSYTGSPNDFGAVARQFAKHQISCFSPLFAGHGTTNPIDILQLGNVDVWWNQTCQAIERFSDTELFVVGLSLGSIFALKALEEYPQIKAGAVLGCPVFAGDFTNISAGFYQYVKKIDDWQQVSVSQHANHVRTVQHSLPTALHSIQATAQSVQNHLARIEQPLFIGHGTKDELVNYQAAKDLANSLPNAAPQLHLYPDAGHVITVNQARQDLTQNLINFVTTY